MSRAEPETVSLADGAGGTATGPRLMHSCPAGEGTREIVERGPFPPKTGD